MFGSFVKHCIGVASVVVLGGVAQAANIYDSGGFELTRFVPGTLQLQDALVRPWTVAGGGTATVGAATGLTGQGVTLNATNNLFAYPKPTAANPSASDVILIDWDEKVTQTTSNPGNYGPMIGVDVADSTTGPLSNPLDPASGTVLRLATFGVDATTGELLLHKGGGLDITPADVSVSFDVWNHFQISLDYGSKTYSVSLNGVVVDSNVPFVNPSLSNFTDAALASLQATASNFNLDGVAQFDNYAVTLVPEPASFTVLGLGVAGVVLRRNRRSSGC